MESALQAAERELGLALARLKLPNGDANATNKLSAQGRDGEYDYALALMVWATTVVTPADSDEPFATQLSPFRPE
jgi:hypothetical protein